MEILIADDHEIIRHGLKLALKDIWPLAITFEAEDLTTGIKILSRNSIDLVVFNINIPGKEKLEDLIRFISKETKVAIFSPYQMRGSVIDSLRDAGTEIFLFRDSSIEKITNMFLRLFERESEN